MDYRREWTCYEVVNNQPVNKTVVELPSGGSPGMAVKKFVKDLDKDGPLVVGVEGYDRWYRVTSRVVRQYSTVAFIPLKG